MVLRKNIHFALLVSLVILDSTSYSAVLNYKVTKKKYSNERKPRHHLFHDNKSRHGRPSYFGTCDEVTILSGEERIVGGSPANRYQFPYLVSIQCQELSKMAWMPFCGGAIISPIWIITAAHCVEYMPDPSYFRVVAGILVLDEAVQNSQTKRIKKLFVHDKYGYENMTNDIGFIELDSPLHYNDAIGPVKLPEANQRFTGTVHLAGWGRVNNKQKTHPSLLKFIQLQIISKKECKHLTTSASHLTYNNITDEMICALPEIGQSGCSGDSGGPLIQDRVLVGVMSFGADTCGENETESLPNVFARVSYFVNYIRNVTGSSSRHLFYRC